MSVSVLVVDDDSLACVTLKSVLERAGHEARTASTIAEALAVAATHPPRCLVVDRRLPDGDGLDLAAELRTKLGDDLRIVVLSGDAVPEQADHVDEVLLKPVGARRVIDAVQG